MTPANRSQAGAAALNIMWIVLPDTIICAAASPGDAGSGGLQRCPPGGARGLVRR